MAELLSSRSHPKRRLALRSEDVVRAYKRLSRVERAFLDLHEPAPVTSYFTVLLVVFVTALLELGIVRWARRGPRAFGELRLAGSGNRA